ncbi:MAG: sulfur carrier protein ThiS [Phycisphaerae bacterium]|nr:sulfur carrier protein ThiS [Phycisphaerae bacterium]
MQIIVNGETREIDGGCTVATLLECIALTTSRPMSACAVEVNRGLVPRRQHAERCLADGDVVEIVTLVGGG